MTEPATALPPLLSDIVPLVAYLLRKVLTHKQLWVAGSIGPTSKSLSLSPDANDPTFRPYSFDQMKEAYKAQAEALAKGGVDLFLIETCFDALNVKAALAAISEVSLMLPVIISLSVGDRSGRTLTGQTLEAFYTSVKHYPLLAFGLNCSLGAAELTTLLEDVDKWCECAVSCYPNAGLPNEMGGYDQSPEAMAAQVKDMAARGLVNIVGGCCGTTPEHIKAIAAALNEKGAAGRYSTWASPVAMTIIEVGVEYAVAYINGEITSKNDGEALAALLNAKIDGAKVACYTNAEGTTFDNYYTILLAPVDFNDYL